MTSYEAAVVSAYTGYLIGEFSEMQKYVEIIMGRPVFSHEMGDSSIQKEIQRRSYDDFITLPIK